MSAATVPVRLARRPKVGEIVILAGHDNAEVVRVLNRGRVLVVTSAHLRRFTVERAAAGWWSVRVFPTVDGNAWAYAELAALANGGAL